LRFSASPRRRVAEADRRGRGGRGVDLAPRRRFGWHRGGGPAAGDRHMRTAPPPRDEIEGEGWRRRVWGGPRRRLDRCVGRLGAAGWALGRVATRRTRPIRVIRAGARVSGG